MDLEPELQSELLIARILEEDSNLLASTIRADQIQLNEILGVPESTGDSVDDADVALTLFSADMRLTSDAAYVEFLQVSEEAKFSESRHCALNVAAAEKKLHLDMLFARKLQDDEDAGRGMGVVGDIESVLGSDLVVEIMASDPNDKGKGKGKTRTPVDDDYPISQVSEKDMAKGSKIELERSGVQTKLHDFFCGICLEPSQETYSPMTATLCASSSKHLPFGLRLPCPGRHSYCVGCLTNYIRSKLEPEGTSGGRLDMVVFPVRCPECPVLDWPDGIPDDIARKILSDELMLQWYHQKLVDSHPRYYCPNPRCSARLELHEERDDPRAVCPACEVLICVPCRVEWHQNLTCAAFQALPPDERSPEDQMVLQLAKVQHWRRCPRCAHIIELTIGCNHIRCRCSAEFCFRCGSLWDKTRGRCSREPACQFWDENMLLEAHERERDPELEQPHQPANVPPAQPYTNTDDVFEGITDIALPGNNRFTTQMALTLSCGYCSARLNSVAGLRYHLRNVRRHPVYACCGRLFPERNGYNNHTARTGILHDNMYENEA